MISLLAGCASAPGHRTSAAAAGHPHSPAVERLLSQAKAALDDGDMKRAQSDFALASQQSDDPAIAHRATALALALHDSQAAQSALARWQALGASHSQVLGARAQIALDQGDTDTARAQLTDMTADGSKQAWQRFGKIMLNARDTAQAGQLLKQVATPKRLPDDQLAWLAMSEIGQKLGRYGYAQRIADLASERFHSARTYAWSAQLSEQRGDKKAAAAMYDKAVKAAPDDIDLRMAYAGMVAKDGHIREARRILAQGRQDERTFAARTAYAARERDMKDLRSIYDEMRRSPEPVRKKSYYLLGRLAVLVDEPQAAIDWLAQVPLKGDHGIDAGIQRAALLQQTGHPGKAHALVDRMRQAYASHAKVIYRLDRVDAQLYFENKDYAKAVTAFTRAMRGSADSSELLYGRALAYAGENKVSAAIADLRAVRRLNPENINAINALGYILADAGRDLHESRILLARALKASPNNPAIIDSWGWLQFRLGHLDKAEKALRRSWKLNKDPDVGAHLARVLLARGKHAEARRIYHEARKIDPTSRGVLALKGKFKP